MIFPRVLILCQPIAPPAYSPRIMTLARHMQETGWHCEIATEEDTSHTFCTDVCPIHIMPAYGNTIADKIFGTKEQAFFRYICTHIDITSFDLLFCASYYFFPLQTACKLAKKYHLPLIIDLRDIVEQWGKVDYFTRSFTRIQWLDTIAKKVYTSVNLRKRNQALRQADAVTTVSPWHQKYLSQYNRNTYLIYNGYDAATFYPKDIHTKTFNITFLGKYYHHYKDCPSMLFAALRNLLGTGKIKQQDIRVHFYTTEFGFEDITQGAAKYGLTDIVQVAGYIPPSQAVERMHESSILLVLTTSSVPNGPYGMMGTKFYEILGIEKPCLCLVSDEGSLAQAIHETHAGLAATHIEEVEQFIMEKYMEWKAKGYTRQQVRNKEQFTRQNAARQFEDLFLQCVK